MNLKTTLFAAAAVIAMAPAANAYEGLYGAIGAGLSYNDNDLDTEGDGALVFDSEGDYDNGIGIYTALGYAHGNGWRTELEYSNRDNDVRHFAGDGLAFTGWNSANGTLDGNLNVHALMLNNLYDFDMGNALTPYLGFGVGVASFKGEFTGTNPTAAGGFGTLSINEGGVRRIAGQLIAGLSYELAENLNFDVSYRFMKTRRPEFDGTITGAALAQSVSTAYENHSLFAGLRWNFGAAAPAAPEYKDCWDGSSVPVTADCPPQPVADVDVDRDPLDITVYFDYDKSTLTPEAANLIREAASSALENDVDTVVVQGNTDTSGGSAYNQRLSERRAAVVTDALIANGIPADRIRTEALGETNLAKPTPDGTREPLNRRADVKISFE